ncbi:putative serine protease K12H4.7 [Colias croceus]|uniref:putative serine protease K12H4.7 n=1 Tax=Colias crocea TaxID=72248 RepID=UPI001E2815CF|nr:putative serine protease K12H4.7 [Colias croceus]XP_045509498.1 putative serine protease K12H4.7 [Colias croceus]
MSRLFFIYVVLLPALLVSGSKQFRLGRGKGGNLGLPVKDVGHPLPRARWFQQKLDHASPTDLRTWKQRYYVNDSFYDANNPGPVFLMVGGEGPADAKWMVKGSWVEYAEKFKAVCIMLEHRYYGESRPTKDISTKNLQYLSSSQALADIANFINAMNAKYGFDTTKVKWVAFGGSYPGSLVAWLRIKYPHLVHAAISSSGPLLAKLNFMEYYEVVADAITEKTASSECVNRIKDAHEQIITLMTTNPEHLDQEFRTCKPLKEASEDDKKNFFNSIADDFAELVQYNEDNRISQDKKMKNFTINTICDMLVEEQNESNIYIQVGKFNSIILDMSNQTCLDYSYDNMIQELRNMSYSATEGGRQWMYQTCTEFGFYQTSTAEVELFGDEFPLEFFIKQCEDIFGDKFDEKFIANSVAWTNNEYGGLGITASRVMYVHGSIDPWHALGITSTQHIDAPAIYVKGTAHCADMYPPRDEDLPELVRARIAIQNQLADWLQLP